MAFVSPLPVLRLQRQLRPYRQRAVAAPTATVTLGAQETGDRARMVYSAGDEPIGASVSITEVRVNDGANVTITERA